MKLKLDLSGLSCEHCIKHVNDALLAFDGINEAEVDLASAVIDVDEKVTENHLRDIIDDAGYELTGITLINY